MKKYMIILLMLASVCFGADTTYYINDATASGDWAAGDNTNDGLAKATPWRTLAYFIDNQTVGSGFTATAIIRSGVIATDVILSFDDSATHDSRNFTFQVDPDTGGTWDLGDGYAGVDFFVFSDVTSGTLTVEDCIIDNSSTRYLVDPTADKGMNVIFNDCDIELTQSSSRFYSGTTDSVGVDRDITINDSTIASALTCLSSPTGDLSLDNVSITSTSGDGCSIVADIDSAKFKSVTITALTSGKRGFYVDPANTLGVFEWTDGVVHSDSYSVYIEDGLTNCFIDNSEITADSGSAVIIGREAFGTGVAADNVVIQNSTITATYTDSRALILQRDVENISVLKNTIAGASHAFFIIADNGEIAYNTVTSTEAITMGVFGDNLSIHHNTARAAIGTCFITAAPGNTGIDTDQNASTNLKIYNNIFVSADGLAYYDYDASTGITGEAGRCSGNGDVMNDWQDYNVFWRESNFSSGVVELGEKDSEQICDTMAEVLTAWKTATSTGDYWNSNFGDTNDKNSLIVDPQFKDAANGDFEPRNSAVEGMGAVGYEKHFGRRPRYNPRGR